MQWQRREKNYESITVLSCVGILLGQMSHLLYLLKPVVAEPNNKPVSSDHPVKYEKLALGNLFLTQDLNYFFVSVYSLLGSL